MTKSSLKEFAARWLPLLEIEMQTALRCDEPAVGAHYSMMHYHMGWVDANFRADHLPAGKRLRPLLCLLACAEAGGEPDDALPAAAAIEILHNFSLVHDDIEDGDAMRRHRATVWTLWGVPLAINAGDGMFALSFSAIQQLAERSIPPATVLSALKIFTDTCVALTEGQYLDMSFERRAMVSVDEYIRMIQGKTAALVGASVAIGATIGGGAPEQLWLLQRFGQAVGIAFQIQDDILGIWGDPQVTGKAAGNDILRKKKSLPLLYALANPTAGPKIAALLAGDVTAAQLPEAMALLDAANTRAYADEQMLIWHTRGIAALQDAFGPDVKTGAIWELVEGLLGRKM